MLRGPGSQLSSRQRSCEYFLLSDPYLCLKVLLYKPQHASSWIKTSSPAASVTACLLNVMLLKKRGNLEQSEPLCPVPNHSELLQTQKGKEENLLRLVKQNNATSYFFIYRRTFFSLYFHTLWGLPNVGRGGRVGAREGRSGGGMTKRHECTKANKQTE